MRQIVPPIALTQKILGQQKTDEVLPYRLTAHCIRVEQPEGVLLYHTLTGELLLLSRMEAALLDELPGCVPPPLEELVLRRFLVLEGSDDVALADLVRNITLRLRKKNNALTKYKIFTTMNCNARCFYCYEAGWKKSSMSEQTALDTARYIMAHRGGKPVRLDWFGGEPLVNIQAIDVITDYLRRQDVDFHSTMISNGYLFDEALVRRARDDWNLTEVQITLDGTEEIYNRRKAYVNPEGSPYQRVLRNIGLLLDASIWVNIRLNMDGGNEKDLYLLCGELAERFAGKPKFGVYLAPLVDHAGIDPMCYSDVQKFRALCSYAESKRIAIRKTLSRGFILNSCIADSDSSTTVTPEGRLGRCNNCIDGTIWGSIYSDGVDEEVLRQWRERKPTEEACRTCAIYPQCGRLKKCPSQPEYCSPLLQSYREQSLRGAVLRAYEDWKAAGQN